MATNELPFRVVQSEVKYPAKDTELIFGSDFAHSEFVIPMARFTFYDATGEDSTAPAIYIRLGGTFSTQLSQGWQEASGIFGSVTPGQANDFSSFKNTTDIIGRVGGSLQEALSKSIMNAMGAGMGFVGSAGQSGKAQAEFLTRKLFNSFQQLIYQGPRFRSFQLPFNMKPTSYEEAKIMRDIIHTFRVASSPRGDSKLVLSEDDENRLSESALSPDEREAEAKRIEGLPQAEREAELTQQAIDAFNLNTGQKLADETGNPLTFGYPDMCQLELILYKKGIPADKTTGTPEGEIVSLFISDFCMIENVGLDYGAQNKMVFLTNPESIADGEYFASEVNMTIALRESVLITAGYAQEEHNTAGRTIF